MADQLTINGKVLRIIKGDITDMDVQSFVYYARHDLVLGSGFGTAITMRGGPSVQEELKQFGAVDTTEVVITNAGEMKAGRIIHAVGPRFQEENTERKLKATVLNSLKCADDNNLEVVAFPPMGAGFYGVPLDVSADVTLGTIKEYLSGNTKLKEVVVCLLDNREYKPFKTKLSAMDGA